MGFWALPAGAAAVTGIGSLLSSIFSGIGKKQKEKRALKMLEKIKPQTPYYGIEKNLSKIDPVVQKAIFNMMGQRFGGSLGIDFGSMFGKQNMNVLGRSGGGTLRAGKLIAKNRNLET